MNRRLVVLEQLIISPHPEWPLILEWYGPLCTEIMILLASVGQERVQLTLSMNELDQWNGSISKKGSSRRHPYVPLWMKEYCWMDRSMDRADQTKFLIILRQGTRSPFFSLNEIEKKLTHNNHKTINLVHSTNLYSQSVMEFSNE